MKTNHTLKASFLAFVLLASACRKDSNAPNSAPKNPAEPVPSERKMLPSYQQTNLVADKAGLGAGRIDPNLLNAWGIAIGSSGAFWISANGAGLSVVYNDKGTQLIPPVSVPFHGAPNAGAPSGVVFNSTPDFVIPGSGLPAKFIFAAEDGTISAWNKGSTTIPVSDRSKSGAVYKGIAIGNNQGKNFLYVTNFHDAKIAILDDHFHLVTESLFLDPTIPVGFAPFNIRNSDGNLYVTYALQKPDHHDDQAGPGNGFVNVFGMDGVLIKRLASMGTLNSPWGIDKAPEGFGLGKNAILVGNFGDGRINVYSESAAFLGQLRGQHEGVLTIDGLWAITFPQNGAPAGDPNTLFFTAGPNAEADGLFGFLNRK